MPSQFPIDLFIPQIIEQLGESNRLILEAEPGAGKSTRVPLSLLYAPGLKDKKILMLEPRRLAARSIARFMAAQLSEPVGEQVGYQVRNDRRCSKATRLEIVTEGILTRRLQQDPELGDIGLIIFDEFHERSLQADLSLALCVDVQQSLRPDLRLMLMSATLDTGLISERLGGAPVISCPGRCFPVSCEYQPRPEKHDLSARIRDAVLRALKAHTGDLLVFLPGVGEIRQCQQRLEEVIPPSKATLCPLYGGLSPEQQDRAIRPGDGIVPKVVLATNIAETSLTIKGVTVVVDSGLVRQAQFDPSSGMTRLITERISQASAEQRRGRAGRLGPGHCYRLWPESHQQSLIPQQPEEIGIADLAGLQLELAEWGVPGGEGLCWITEPPEAHLTQAKALLIQLELLDAEGRVTASGSKALRLGVHPRLAHMLLKSKQWQLGHLACDLAAVLTERDIFKRGDSGVDLTSRLMALRDYRAHRKTALKKYPLIPSVAEQALMNSRNWLQRLGLKGGEPAPSVDELDRHCGRLLAQAYPDRIAQRRSAGDNRYRMRNGKGVYLAPEDPLCREAWLVTAVLDGRRRDSRTCLAAPVLQVDIETDFSHQLQVTEQVRWDADKGGVDARRTKQLGSLVLHSERISQPDPARVEEALLDGVRQTRLQCLPWNSSLKRWLQRARWLAQYRDQNVSGWPRLDEEGLLDKLDSWLAPYLSGLCSIKGLSGKEFEGALQSILSWDQQQELLREAPCSYLTPVGRKVTIDYAEDQGPKVSVPLQELFGVLESPRLSWGQVPLVFELLSPARRPIQVTADLKGFWSTSYFEVRKEMAGRYPKHRWPEEPLNEQPGRSIKK